MPPKLRFSPRKKVCKTAHFADEEVKKTNPVLPLSLLKYIFLHIINMFTWPHQDDMDKQPIRLAKTLALVCRDFHTWMRAVIWRTVYITNDNEALSILTELVTRQKTSPVHAVRNIWVASGRWKHHEATGQAFADGRPLCADVAVVGDELTTSKKVQNIAVDVTLLAQGWFACDHVCPTQVVLLDNIDPCAEKQVDFAAPLFSKVTHLIVEPSWGQLAQHIKTMYPLTIFNALTHLCVRFPEGGNPHHAMRLMNALLRSHRLKMLVVCLHPGINPVCKGNSPMMEAFTNLTKAQRRVFVLPYVRPMCREWEAILGAEPTVWERAEEERVMQEQERDRRRCEAETWKPGREVARASSEPDSQNQSDAEQQDWQDWLIGYDTGFELERVEEKQDVADEDCTSVDLDYIDLRDGEWTLKYPVPTPVPAREIIVIDD